MAFPSDVLGSQALYNILENIIPDLPGFCAFHGAVRAGAAVPGKDRQPPRCHLPENDRQRAD